MKRRLAPTAGHNTFPGDTPSLSIDVDTEQRDALVHQSVLLATEKRRTNGQIHPLHGQIHPLHEDPILQTLTPRSLAKNVAELDALRSRVHELEIKLALHDVETLPPAYTPSKSKLPPLAQDIGLPEARADGSRSTTDLKSTLISASSASALDRLIATAPDFHIRKPIAPPLVLLPTSPSKVILAPVGETASHANTTIHDSAPEASIAPDVTPLPTEDPPSPTPSVLSTSSPQREQAKITLEQDGDMSLAISQRQRLYQVLKRVSTMVNVTEDDLTLLKKLVDAEIGDVIAFLLSVESLDDTAQLEEKLAHILQNGSPSKHKLRHQFRIELPKHHPVWSIQYPLQKIARNLEQLRSSTAPPSPSKEKLDVIVLVSSGAYNPIHMLHIRAFYVARQYVESNYKFPVVGAFISPSHDTFVRVKNRRNPHEMITKRHRLGLIEAAVASSSWIEVDKWEITRRRVLDYLSTLTHVREMCESHFAHFKFHIVYVCGCNTVVKLSHSALRDEGFGCITVCRPTQTQMVTKHLGKTLAKSTTIVEDTGVLHVDLERATSFRVRQSMAVVAGAARGAPDKELASLEMMVGKPAMQYMVKHTIPAKVAGKETWNDEDKAWRPSDLTYVEYIEG